MRKLFQLLSLICLIFIFASCSNASNPTTPSTSILPNQQEITSEMPGDLISDGKPLNPTHGVFGIWRVRIDTANMTAEIVPARNAQAIGNIFDADLSQFLEVSPCANCLTIPRVYLDGYQNLNMVVRMKHPFGNIATRPDLHGFDVRGIFILPSDTTNADIKVMRPAGVEEDASYSTQLLNADGYTSHFDELASDARYFIGGTDVIGNLNPFLRFFEDYSTPPFDPHAPAGQNVMPVGSGNYDRTAVFKKLDPGSILDFYIVADVAYGQSAVFANRTNPQYYLPAFHRTEPWRVEYWIENNILQHGEETSTADVVVQVFDWQQGATVDPAYPNPSNLSGIPEQSNVLRVELSIPELQNDPIVVATPESGTGTPSDPLRYRLTVTNTNQFEDYLVTGLMSIRDDLYGQASPHGRMPIPASPAGFPYETLDILDYSLYMTVYVNITDGYLPLGQPLEDFSNNEIVIPRDNLYAPENIDGGDRTTLYPNFFMDPSNRKFQYRWDYNYDGITFDIDGSGLPSPEINYATPGKKNTALRVRTNSTPPREYICEIPVYAEGLAFSNTIKATEANRTSTGSRRSHTICAEDDYVYQVYVSEIGSQRDIWLAILDRNGNITTHKVTDDAAVDFDPSITVRKGSDEGIYVAYSSADAGNCYVHVTYGNLDGSGFDPSHNKRVSSAGSVIEYQPVLYWHGGTMCVYYMHYLIMTGYVYGAHSDDNGETWNNDGFIVNNGSNAQLNPTACYGGFSRSVLVWEDYINVTDRGTDLWMAETTDGYTFEEIRNISSFEDKTYEDSPSVTHSSGGLVDIVYQAYPDGSDRKNIRLKAINISTGDDCHLDLALTEGTSEEITYTQPSICSMGSGNYVVACGKYTFATQEMSLIAFDVRQGMGLGDVYVNTYFNEVIGNAPADYDGPEVFAAIDSYQPYAGITEIFITYRNFMTGSYFSATNPKQYFAETKMMYFITDNE